MAEPLRVVQSVQPVRITHPRDGVFVFDMGQNMVGLVSFEGFRTGRDDRVALRYAETLTPDGLLYLDNLRSARSLDTYVLKGSGPPRCGSHGLLITAFGMSRVRGYPGKPSLDALEGRLVHDDMQRIADFESSNELLNTVASQHRVGRSRQLPEYSNRLSPARRAAGLAGGPFGGESQRVVPV